MKQTQKTENESDATVVKASKKDVKDVVGTVILALIFIVALIALINTVRIFGAAASSIENAKSLSASSGGISGNAVGNQAIALSVLPKGTPAVYGTELGIKYDDVSAANPQKADVTIKKLGSLDVSIQLSGDKLERYKKIGLAISCEYCCGAEAIIFPDGQAACGCAHSYAMRGLAKYLLQEHPDMIDEQILEEMAKWKVLFFPEIHQQKAAVLQSKGIEMNYINLASNKYRGIEQGASAGAGGSMGGGC